MKKLTCLLAAGASAVAFAASAHAAAYIKFDGIDGEAKAAEWRGANTLYLTTEEEPQAVGLLLPAVQAAREAARRTSARGRTVDEFEIEDAGKRWTLYDAKVMPTRDPYTVEISYRCKDWTDMRSGRKGSDCASAYGKDGKKGGNVETTWKVEKGE
ncbi:hypothetical protein [Hyphococcus luteus]|uniref:Uncharacterized protein n=1 Tax=Hyphococcus luteus TaxID=2058213 RepID=A0A2S7KAV6_9PROT|nr:hypothetical protein [Marinicaulis flavus]PQA89641.1 hypothetical protein CW354_01895 [Marinicaulis flavus]